MTQVARLYGKFNKLFSIFPPTLVWRFLTVGATGALLSLGVLYIAKEYAHLNYIVAGLCSWLFANIFVYISNSIFTFRLNKGARGFARFSLAQVATDTIGFGLYILFVNLGVWYILASILSAGCKTPLSFLLSRNWIWKKKI